MKKILIIGTLAGGLTLCLWTYDTYTPSGDLNPSVERIPASTEDTQTEGQDESTQAQHDIASVDQKQSEAIQKPKLTCTTITLRHESNMRNRDIEDFLEDTNIFAINDPALNPASICIRVNQKAVHHQYSKKKQEVTVGPVVGPDSIIELSYCPKGISCKTPCKIESNAFMDGLMTGAQDSFAFDDSWGDENAADKNTAQKKRLQQKAKELQSLAQQGDLNESNTIRKWTTLKTKTLSCTQLSQRK